MPRKVCIICKTTSSSRFSKAENYQEHIWTCFGVSINAGSHEFLCDGCRKILFRHQANPKLQLFSRVNSKKGNFANQKSVKSNKMRARNLMTSHSNVAKIKPLLLHLPGEVLLNILSFLQVEDIKAFGLTCKNALSYQEQLWKKLCKRDFGELITDIGINNLSKNWKSTYQVLDKVYSLLSEARYSVETMETNQKVLDDQLTKKTTEVKNLETTLASLLDKNTSESATVLQEQIFRAVLYKKQHQSTDGFVRAKYPHGRPVVLAPVRCPEVPSNKASKRTIRDRSKKQENFIEATSTQQTQPDNQKAESINTQRISLINRDKDSYESCAKKAGLKIFGSFTIDQASALKKEMPFETWRLVKRVLTEVAGRDVMGSEKKLREHLEESYFEYDCGTFETIENDISKTVTFVRCTSLRQVLIKTMSQLRESNELMEYECIPKDTLKLLLCGDKGSKQTKLMMTILNSKLQYRCYI